MTYNSEKLRNMLRQTARWNSRLALLHKNTRLNCVEHGVQAVADFHPLAQEAVLACGCHRSVGFDLPDADHQELIAFLASPEGQRRRVAVGSQNSTKHFSVTYEEDLPK